MKDRWRYIVALWRSWQRRDRPFSWVELAWTDTGERPWWWCLLGAALGVVIGMKHYYEGDTLWCLFFLVFAGVNLGMFGMRRAAP